MSLTPIDGCTAAATIAYAMSEAAYIFPITPSSPMAELVSNLASKGQTNLFGERVLVRQMQSEAGAAGALHGAATVGTLATTFTSSQGLLLMLPTLYKLSGELLPCVLHIGARTIATEALSIFGDHSDIYAIRGCGCALLCSASVKEAVHMAIVAHAASVASSVPFCHFMDGFRTTHEVQTIPALPTHDELRACMDEGSLAAFRARALSPSHPIQRGTAQNPDIHFQAVEANNPFYGERIVAHCEAAFERIAAVFGVQYRAFEYYGDPQATDILVLMGSATEVAIAVAARQRGVGVVRVRLYRPFSAARFVRALPVTARRLCVLDRGKDPQAVGEPLFQDVCAALRAVGLCGRTIERVIGGRYGLSSKDFTPGMCVAVLRNLASESPKTGFTVGIEDDVMHTNLDYREGDDLLPRGVRQCLVWGLGGDGTVGANKAGIKLAVEAAGGGLYGQGYFAYDANKSGGLTISHLRFGHEAFEAPYGVLHCDYLACHHASYVRRFPGLLGPLRRGGTFVLNCPWSDLPTLEDEIPAELRREIALRGARFYVIDASKIALEAGLGPYVNMVLQTVFFALSRVVEPADAAVELLKSSVARMYESKGPDVVARNIRAIDLARDPQRLVEVAYPAAAWAECSSETKWDGEKDSMNRVSFPADLEDFKRDIFDPLNRWEGNAIPVSKVPPAGEVPHTGTSQLGKRGIAELVPHWRGSDCVQCNQCSFVCPHAVIRPYLLDAADQARLREDPDASTQLETVSIRNGKKKKGRENSDGEDLRFAIGVSTLDCTGCGVCAETCPAKCLEMVPLSTEHPSNAARIRFLHDTVHPKKGSDDGKKQLTPQNIGLLRPPLLEFPGSCPGCGETPLVRLLTQMAGQRMCMAAATGCNSIWGGSYPSVPYTRNSRGEGPAWHNSLFEDAAELGYGMATGYRCRRERLAHKIEEIIGGDSKLSPELLELLSEWVRDRENYEKSYALRGKIVEKIESEDNINGGDASIRDLIMGARDLLARTSFWVLGGDGWAYDIGFGGLDHLAASGEDINVLVMDTEVYSNTGGQKSKATPLGAQAKFCLGGKDTPKKDLGRMLMGYESVYVASVALGANMAHCLKVLAEAEAYPGPSVVIAYTPCIEHHIVGGMRNSVRVQKLAVETGFWLLYRFNPALAERGENPFSLDSRSPTRDLKEYLRTQGRYAALEREAPEEAARLQAELRRQLETRFERYQRLADFFEPVKNKKSEPVNRITSCIHCHPESATNYHHPNKGTISPAQLVNHGPLIQNTPNSLFCSLRVSEDNEEVYMKQALMARDKARTEASYGRIRVCKDVYWIGAVDTNIRDFHGIETARGSTYNSYLILGAFPTVVDTVKAPFAEGFLASLAMLIDPALVRFVVVNHAEPDHSSALPALLAACPRAEVLCNARCAAALSRLYPTCFTHRPAREVKDGETFVLEEGQTLWFMDTPMVHWPESMYTYLEEERCLFCIDSFGQHIASAQRFDDELENIDCESPFNGSNLTLAELLERARSYYANILVPFGGPIKRALDKLIEHIHNGGVCEKSGGGGINRLPNVLATAHGVVWRNHVGVIVSMYQRWISTFSEPVNKEEHRLVDRPRVVILYDTMYGATERMAGEIARGVRDANGIPVVLRAGLEKITRTADELFGAVAVALGSPTLNNGCLPSLEMHMSFVKGLRFEGRKGVAFGSYGWNVMGQKVLSEFMSAAGIQEVCPPISSLFTPDEEVMKKCYEVGLQLVNTN